VITVYISIGNSDDKLPQARWADFLTDMDGAIREHAIEVHGEWHSLPDAPWQNACWCVVIAEPRPLASAVTRIRANYGQESAAWAEAPVTHFI
jgi:hypothetical protein